MYRGFEDEFEPVPERQDRELTLGPATLLVLGLCLLALCGVCFGFGYAIGHRGTSSGLQAVAKAEPSVQSDADILKAQQRGRRSAGSGANSADASAPAATRRSTAAGQKDASAARSNQTSASVRSAAQSPAPKAAQKASIASVGPAVPYASESQTGGGSRVHPALSPSALQGVRPSPGWMVQIAAVSHSEDAQVLVSALRRRGYAVSVRRDPVDMLMHVQVGPFPSRDTATGMRQKLLNDGYNAILQP